MLCQDRRADAVRHAEYDETQARAPSITSPVIFVGRTRCGSVAGDLRPTGVRLGQCGGEGDARAGDLSTGRVRRLERRRDGDCRTGARAAAATASAAEAAPATLAMYK